MSRPRLWLPAPPSRWEKEATAGKKPLTWKNLRKASVRRRRRDNHDKASPDEVVGQGVAGGPDLGSVSVGRVDPGGLEGVAVSDLDLVGDLATGGAHGTGGSSDEAGVGAVRTEDVSCEANIKKKDPETELLNKLLFRCK